MSDMTCRHCYAETTNGLVLCDLCQMLLAKNLEFLPVYFKNVARWRPGNAGVRSVPGSREPTRPTTGSDRVGTLLNEAGVLVSGWVQALIEDRPQAELPASHGEESNVRVACWFLSEHLTTISTLEWAGTIVHETTDLEQKLRKMTTEVAPGWYAGECKMVTSSGSACGCDTFVVPGLTWVSCRQCGSMTYARDHLPAVLDEARGWKARPKALAEAIVALVDTEQSVPKLYARIRQWAHQGDVMGTKLKRRAYVYSVDEDRMVVGSEEYGPAKYLLGDVLDRLLRDVDDAHSTDGCARAS